MSEDEVPEGLEDDAPAEAFETDDGEVEALMAEIAALKDQLLRVAADAENTKRRVEREANDARAYAIQKFARDLLGAADNLSRATAHAPKDSADQVVKNFVIGVEMTEKELQQAFDRNGLKKVEPKPGEKFDPHQHQAMMEQPAEGVAPGAVVSTLQAGYQLFGRTVRPAMVVVAAKAAPPPADGGGPNPYAAPGTDGAGGSIDTKA